MLLSGEDYYINSDGNVVFTQKYHLKRGKCCKNGCFHCPWNFKKGDEKKIFKNK